MTLIRHQIVTHNENGKPSSRRRRRAAAAGPPSSYPALTVLGLFVIATLAAVAVYRGDGQPDVVVETAEFETDTKATSEGEHTPIVQAAHASAKTKLAANLWGVEVPESDDPSELAPESRQNQKDERALRTEQPGDSARSKMLSRWTTPSKGLGRSPQVIVRDGPPCATCLKAARPAPGPRLTSTRASQARADASRVVIMHGAAGKPADPPQIIIRDQYVRPLGDAARQPPLSDIAAPEATATKEPIFTVIGSNNPDLSPAQAPPPVVFQELEEQTPRELPAELLAGSKSSRLAGHNDADNRYSTVRTAGPRFVFSDKTGNVAPRQLPGEVVIDLVEEEAIISDQLQTDSDEVASKPSPPAELDFATDVPAAELPLNSTAIEAIATDRSRAEKLAVEKLAVEKLAVEKLAVERLAAERLAAERLAAERLAVERLATVEPLIQVDSAEFVVISDELQQEDVTENNDGLQAEAVAIVDTPAAVGRPALMDPPATEVKALATDRPTAAAVVAADPAPMATRRGIVGIQKGTTDGGRQPSEVPLVNQFYVPPVVVETDVVVESDEGLAAASKPVGAVGSVAGAPVTIHRSSLGTAKQSELPLVQNKPVDLFERLAKAVNKAQPRVETLAPPRAPELVRGPAAIGRSMTDSPMKIDDDRSQSPAQSIEQRQDHGAFPPQVVITDQLPVATQSPIETRIVRQPQQTAQPQETQPIGPSPTETQATQTANDISAALAVLAAKSDTPNADIAVTAQPSATMERVGPQGALTSQIPSASAEMVVVEDVTPSEPTPEELERRQKALLDDLANAIRTVTAVYHQQSAPATPELSVFFSSAPNVIPPTASRPQITRDALRSPTANDDQHASRSDIARFKLSQGMSNSSLLGALVRRGDRIVRQIDEVAQSMAVPSDDQLAHELTQFLGTSQRRRRSTSHEQARLAVVERDPSRQASGITRSTGPGATHNQLTHDGRTSVLKSSTKLAQLERPQTTQDEPAPIDDPINGQQLRTIPSDETDTVPTSFNPGFRSIGEMRTSIGVGGDGELPQDYATETFAAVGEVIQAMGFTRAQMESMVFWEAPALCHQPLYFEEVNLERHGYSIGVFQPALSAAHFFGRVPALPYLMHAERARESRYTLGHYRPGSNAPYELYVPPFSVRGSMAETIAVIGLMYAIP
jgi:hypothetical protein